MDLWPSRAARALVVLLGALITCLPALAQTPAPTADEIEIFQTLSPEQQNAILERVTGGGSGGGALGGGSRSDSTGARDANRDRLDEYRRRNLRDEDDSLIPQMKADDTVIVQIEFKRRRFVPAQAVPDAAAAAGGATQPLMPQQQPNAQGGLMQQAPVGDWIEPPVLANDERARLSELIDLIQARNPYKLDRYASLTLPGFPPIALGGLTDQQATQRLSVEPALLKLDVKLVRLPLAKVGVEGLKRFGYDLFDASPSTFSPVTDVPVPRTTGSVRATSSTCSSMARRTARCRCGWIATVASACRASVPSTWAASASARSRRTSKRASSAR